MGATPSKKSAKYKEGSNGACPEIEKTDQGSHETDELSYEGFDISLAPEEVLLLVLSFLPAKELVQSARLVCKDWRDTVDRPTIWRKKCLREGRFVVGVMGPQPSDWRDFYFKNPYRRNLVKNSCGEDGMRHWEVLENGGQGWKVERFVGCKAFPNPAVRDNFVTSYGWCSRQQEIDLLAEGCLEKCLDGTQPNIEVSEWYAPRWDCGSQYELEVQLLDKDKKVVDTFSYGPAVTPQWNDSQWKQAMHIFSSYGPGVRYVLFKDKGSDTQFWAGHYGSKMTCASVKLIFHSFKNVEPTNKRILLAVDCGRSMAFSGVNGSSGLTAAMAAGTMAMCVARTEPNSHVFGFTDQLVQLTITTDMRLDQILQIVGSTPKGRTDCVLPIQYAKDNNIPVDVFVYLTDNKTGTGDIPPSEALKQYRAAMKIDAKLCVCAMSSNSFTLADPEDAGMLDIIGLDSLAPLVIRNFALGDI